MLFGRCVQSSQVIIEVHYTQAFPKRETLPLPPSDLTVSLYRIAFNCLLFRGTLWA
jgi:hypothetical protein